MENLLIDWKARLAGRIAEWNMFVALDTPDLWGPVINALEGRIRELRRCIEELEEVLSRVA